MLIEAAPVARIPLAHESLNLLSSPGTLAVQQLLVTVLSNGQLADLKSSKHKQQLHSTHLRIQRQSCPNRNSHRTILSGTNLHFYVHELRRSKAFVVSMPGSETNRTVCRGRRRHLYYRTRTQPACTTRSSRSPLQTLSSHPAIGENQMYRVLSFQDGENVYQACQNMAAVDLCDNCPNIPASIRSELQRLVKESKSTAGGGQRYWSDGVPEDRLRFRDE